jgi:hypothetical protein
MAHRVRVCSCRFSAAPPIDAAGNMKSGAVETMRLAVILILFVLSFPTAGMTQETPHLTFVSEYIRELSVNEHLRELSEREVTSEQDVNRFVAMIRGSTRITLELNAQLSMLKGMHLNEPLDHLTENIAAFYQQKIELHNSMIQLSTTFLSSPKPGVDYGALAAGAPKLTAKLEYIDRSLLQATPLIFATLIDNQPDRQGHMSRLIITRAERDELVRRLQISFGKKLDQENQNLLVSSAKVLRHDLAEAGYKCSDEPL